MTASLSLINSEDFGLTFDFANTTLSNEVVELDEDVEAIVLAVRDRATGSAHKGGDFGNDIVFPVDFDETNNPNFTLEMCNVQSAG